MFNLELRVSGRGGHAVVALCGELDLADAPAVASHMIAAVAAFGPWIIVDLEGLEFIDCCGLTLLARVLRWTRESGGDLYLAGTRPRVRRVVEMAGLADVFPMYLSVQQAVTGVRLAQSLSAAVSSRQPMPPRGTGNVQDLMLFLRRPVMLPANSSPSAGWMSRGACQHADPELFFPISARPAQEVAAAKAICQTCPVRVPCRTFAVETRQDGIWGGTTPDERYALRRQGPQRPIAPRTVLTEHAGC